MALVPLDVTLPRDSRAQSLAAKLSELQRAIVKRESACTDRKRCIPIIRAQSKIRSSTRCSSH
jgi:hypothetical protein